ncbi:MAG: ATP-binding cassette domain-containing protein [Candidatus Azobacteroides sp.]|nr:ATP-binding cassette domain-containing protein [Candidatus Azobacteroides sp.]
MNQTIIKIESAVPCMPELQFKYPVHWEMKKNEHWAFIGPNGSGKTLLANIICRKIALKQGKVLHSFSGSQSGSIQTISFRDVYDLADYKNMYYQQRFNVSENEEAPLVDDLLDMTDTAYIHDMLEKFNLKGLLGKQIILLSSGELRKFLLVRILQKKPELLILDNPFIGLDTASRKHLKVMLSQMAAISGLQIILIVSSPDDIPEIITHVLPIGEKNLYPSSDKETFLKNNTLRKKLFPVLPAYEHLPVGTSSASGFENAVVMKDVSIRYFQRIILKDIQWTIKKGEKWALLGPNGSGKSTLLSLIYADNPQGYANNITLFDRKRGSGESIWDIKKEIGYVSPEMHLFYLKNVPAIDIVGSGFFDTIGLYRKCNTAQIKICEDWMKIFRIHHLKDTSFLKLSSGEQRLALLARAFVKNPSLIILDEPLHGLDKSNKEYVRRIIEDFCNHPDKTLIYVTHYPEEIPSLVTSYFNLKKNDE